MTGMSIAGDGIMRRSTPISRFDWDAPFAFVLFLTMLFILQLGTMGAILFTGLTLGYAVAHGPQLLKLVGPRGFLFAIPALTLLSTLWSEAPSETFKYSLEFSLTVIAGLLLSAAPEQASVLRGMFYAFGIYVAAALSFGQFVGTGANGQTAFSGLSESKNLLADIASTGLLVSLALFFSAARHRSGLICAAALAAGALEAYAIGEARSTGALLGLAAAVAGFLALLGISAAGITSRAIIITFLGLCMIPVALLYRTFSDSLVTAGLEYFEKDPTFTGRTYIWQRGNELIAEAPILGKGFQAFWLESNADADGLRRYVGLISEGGFSFHNTFIEIQMQLGWFGLIVIGLTMLTGLGFFAARFIARPNLSLCFWGSILVYQMVRMPFETVGFNQFYFSTVLLFAALGSPFAIPHKAAAPGTAAHRDPRPPVSRQPIERHAGDAGALEFP